MRLSTLIAVGSGGQDDVEAMEIQVEAEDEDIRILDVYVDGLNIGAATSADGTSLTVSESELESFIDRFTLDWSDGSETAQPDDYVRSHAEHRSPERRLS